MIQTSLIITAAGKGTRFGTTNKLFLNLKGKPLIIRTCEHFLRLPFFNEALITIALDEKKELETLLKKYALNSFFRVIIGGLTRQESVKLAIEALKPVEKVFIHDGARPNISQTLISNLYQTSLNHPAVIPGIPVADTIKLADDNSFVEKTLERKKLFQIQTPQVFDYALLKSIYQKTEKAIFNNITDEATLFEFFKIPIKIIPGERTNLKLTYPEDLTVLERFF